MTGWRPIADFYDARLDTKRGGPAYRPVRPEQFYLEEREWQAMLRMRAVAELSAFAAPDGVASFDAGARPVAGFAAARNDPGANLFDAVRDRLGRERAAGRRVLIAAYIARLGRAARERAARSWRRRRRRRVADFAAFEALPDGTFGSRCCRSSAATRTDKITVLTEQDILGDRLARPARRRARNDNFIAEVSALQPGDLVVHVDHGIGRYDGLETLDVAGAPHDCLRLDLCRRRQALSCRSRTSRCCRATAREEATAQLDKLGGVGWQSRKARVKKRINEIADELIAHRGAAPDPRGRDHGRRRRGSTRNSPRASRIPETEDQEKAIADTLGDLASGKPMDRLICGDVGFGKTEVALRAAFVAVMAGTQVAVVVPTTLLARQHYRTFTERFAGLPVQSRAALAPGDRQGRGADQGRARRGQDRHRHRHSRAAGEGRRVQASRLAGDRRGAAFRRRAEGTAEEAQGRRPCADADRDADPAHAAAGARRACAR